MAASQKFIKEMGTQMTRIKRINADWFLLRRNEIGTLITLIQRIKTDVSATQKLDWNADNAD